MNKLVIIINGHGGVGKDTICNIVASQFPVKIISAIDPIKDIALLGGWSYDDKSLTARKLLSDLKLAFIHYNDLPLKYILNQYSDFLLDDNQFLFVHIREPSEIKKFKDKIAAPCITLLISSPSSSSADFGNPADDNVLLYNYDFYYTNSLPLDLLHDDFLRFFEKIVAIAP